MLCCRFISLVVLNLKLLALEQVRGFILVLKFESVRGNFIFISLQVLFFCNNSFELILFLACLSRAVIKFSVTCNLELHARTKLVIL